MWPFSQDRTPLFLMSQQTPPSPGSHVCSPPLSAEGPLAQQKRRWTVKGYTGLFSHQAHPKHRLLEAMDTHHDYPKAPSPFTACYCSFRTVPRGLLLPPCSLVQQPAAKAETWQHQQQPKHTLQLPVPDLERWDMAARAEHRAWTITPWTAAICPCSTHGNQLQGGVI